MSSEHIYLFSNRIDPAGVVGLLRRLANVKVTGPDENWSQVNVVTEKRMLRPARKIVFGHNSELYDGPNGRMQFQGMRNYFSAFPDHPSKNDVLTVIQSFQFCLPILTQDMDLDSPEDDDRRDVLFAVCHYLDAVIYTPNTLRDASGQILLSSTQPQNPAATFPALPADLAAEPELVPPIPVKVARRALALTAVAARASLELDESKPDHHRKRIADWINELNIADELEAHERKPLNRPVGSLKEKNFIDTMWQVEGLAILAWALNLSPAPSCDKLVIPADVYESIGLFDPDAGDALLQRPNLRSADQLNAMREHLFMFHWRLRRFATMPVAMDFAAFCKSCPFVDGDISNFKLKNNDLVVGDTQIAKAKPHEIGEAQSIASERCRAINWLHDASELYSKTDTFN